VDGGWLMRDGVEARHAWGRVEAIPFFAYAADRRPPGMALVAVNGVFYALPPGAENTASMVPVKDEAGRTVAFAWKNPCTAPMLDR
jgi:hypothetical protein